MTTELGRLVNDLVEATQEYERAGWDSKAHSAQVAAEKALLEYVEKREQHWIRIIRSHGKKIVALKELAKRAHIP